MKEKTRVLIIGGGASGLFAAISAAERGADVVVLEKEKKAGRKILKTGNGRCNFTNVGDFSFVYHGTEREFARKILERFSPQDTIAAFTSLGIFTTNKSGWIYPHSETAESVLTTLLWRASELHVKIKCNETVRRIEKKRDIFTVFTDTWHYEADRVILSCGSAASLTEKQAPLTGYDLAERLGHTLVKPLPALVPLKVKNAGSFKWAGVRIHAAVSLYAEDLFIAGAEGQVQLTESGISGIPVFAISGQAMRLLDGGLHVKVLIDFFPEFTADQLQALLENRKMQHPGRRTSDLLVGLLPERLIHAVTSRAAALSDRDDNLCTMVSAIKNFETVITGSQGFTAAQCTTGGISTKEVNPLTCESKITPGFYLTGEVLDIDGECGGWNLQFAWSTGYLAGRHAAEAL